MNNVGAYRLENYIIRKGTTIYAATRLPDQKKKKKGATGTSYNY